MRKKESGSLRLSDRGSRLQDGADACAGRGAHDEDFLRPEALDRAYALARKAVQLDPNLPVCRAQLCMVLTFRRRHDEAIAEFERAQALNPNFNDWRFTNSLVYAGNAARALEVADIII